MTHEEIQAKILSAIQESGIYVVADDSGRFINSGMRNKPTFNNELKNARIYTSLRTARINVSQHKRSKLSIYRIDSGKVLWVDDTEHNLKKIAADERKKERAELHRQIIKLSDELKRKIQLHNASSSLESQIDILQKQISLLESKLKK